MESLKGTGTLVRLILRRDRVKLPVWILAITAFMAANVPAIADLYGKNMEQQINYATTTAASIIGRAFGGPLNGPDIGAIILNETFLFAAILAAFMSTLLVVRHTRQNEETGREEMLSSGILGRHASLSAVLVIAVAANVILGGLLSLVFIGNNLSTAGSLGTGAAIAAIGMSFAAVAALTAQISESSRGANSMAAAVIGAAFLLRATGDAMGELIKNGTAIHSEWPSWLSPIGWGQQLHPFTEQNWLVFIPLGLFICVVTAVAYTCNAYRDIGLGLIPSKPGPAHAPKSLSSPFGLALRLQRSQLIGWAAGMATMGVMVGFVAKEFKKMLAENEQITDILQALGGGADLDNIIFGSMMSLMALAIAGYAIQALARMRSEEIGGQLEPVLATSVSKWRWALGHIGCTFGGIVMLAFVLGLSAGVSFVIISDASWSRIGEIVGAAIVHIPAIAVVAAVAVGLFGTVPKFASAAAWAFFAICILMGQFGAILDLPQWLLNVSPFSHTPFVPATEVDAMPLLILGSIALLLTYLGLAAFRRRDITTA